MGFQGGGVGRSGVLAGLIIGLAWVGPEPLQAQVSQDASPPAVQPSVELPTDLARVLRDYERHWSAGEADALAALFVEDGLIFRRGTWIRGRSAIRAAYQTASGPLLLRAITFGTDARTGFIVGAYGYGEAQPVADMGVFVLILRREEGGQWLIVSDLDRGSSG